jgi:hypothetical protein
MEQIYPNICPYSLISGKKYSVNTHLDRWKGTIKGTFSRYEKNKIIGKDEPVWSIVFMDWWGMDLDTQENPCQTQLYLDPIEDLKFYEI